MGLTRALRQRRVRRVLPASLVRVLAATALTLLACEDATQEHAEVLAMVEVPYTTAISKSLAEVPGSRLVHLDLRGGRGDEPVWRGELVTADGTRHLVRVDATLPSVLGTKTLGQKTPAPPEKPKLLPEDAVREVTKPEFGKVTAVELRRVEAKVVWTVDVTTVENDNAHAYDVDAQTGELLDRRSARPQAG